MKVQNTHFLIGNQDVKTLYVTPEDKAVADKMIAEIEAETKGTKSAKRIGKWGCEFAITIWYITAYRGKRA